MNKKIYKYSICVIAICITLLSACQDPWKEQGNMQLQSSKTLLEEISSNPDLATFYNLLKKSGVNKRLEESRSFTVWAPNNASLNGLSQDIINDEEQLITFIENHIAYQSYFTKEAGANGVYSRSLNGKKQLFTKTGFDEITILSADNYFKNGVLHVLDGYVTPKQNAYEYLLSLHNKQSEFIESLNYIGLDTSNAVILYYDPITNQPVYQEGTTFPIQRNRLFEKVSNIASEDSLITYVILNDSAFDFEANALKSFNHFSTQEATDSLSKWHAIKDLVVNGLHQGADLNNLVSVTGVKFGISPNDIVETKKLSNGIAYIVSKINYTLLENKIPSVIIEGVMIDSLYLPSSPRVKTLKDFQQVIYKQLETSTITSSPNPLFYFRYRASTYSGKYMIYARARNTVLTVPFSMAVGIAARRDYTKDEVAAFEKSNYFSIPVFEEEDPTTLNEIPVSVVTIGNAGNKYVYLFSSAGATSTLPTALALNYLRLVPVN